MSVKEYTGYRKGGREGGSYRERWRKGEKVEGGGGEEVVLVEVEERESSIGLHATCSTAGMRSTRARCDIA